MNSMMGKLVRVTSCIPGTGINSERWIVTYEFVGEMFKTGAKACTRPFAVGSVISENSLF